MRKLIVLALLPLVFFTACWDISDQTTGPQNIDNPDSSFNYALPKYYHTTVTQFNIDLYYQQDHAPYTGTYLNGNPVFKVLNDNLNSLLSFAKSPRTITVDDELAEMDLIDITQYELDAGHNEWTVMEIYNMALAIRKEKVISTTLTEASFTIIFLDGHFKNDQGTVLTNVIGVNLVPTPIIAIFKDVISAVSSTKDGKSYMEQLTLAHELGHAFGLVNLTNGVPAIGTHEDDAHLGHCEDTECLMYWANEGTANLKELISNLSQENYSILCQACLNDLQTYVQP